jgi:acetolactate synthase-like protein
VNGGDRIAAGLARHGVRFLFTLCGGHISPILVGAKRLGIRVVDVRDEAAAVFAADAVARLSGVPGVAAVTAGPGVTNTITAVKNAQLAQSPVVLLGGAAATLLKGRGALQDIDQMALVQPHVKWAASARAVRDLAPLLDRAFAEAASGVPGPVFLECPIDLLYDEALVRQMYGGPSAAGEARAGGGLAGWALRLYLQRHLRRLFRPARGGARAVTVSSGITDPGRVVQRGADLAAPAGLAAPPAVAPLPTAPAAVRHAAALLAHASRPVLLLGSQAVLDTAAVPALAQAVAALEAPVFLAGGARGLLGAAHPLQMRHRRKEALRAADLVIAAGVPMDFRLDYGRHIGRRTSLVMINRHEESLRQNRRPQLGVLADPGRFLRDLAARWQAKPPAAGAAASSWQEWRAVLAARDAEREAEIVTQAAAPVGGGLVNPLHLCRAIEARLAPDSVIVADGGDFVGTASYILRPRTPLSWLDPGVFGTLGVGGGFALGAKLCRPAADVWVIYGDGSAAYSLAEIDSLARHGLPVIAVVGNDAGWAQIAREQVEMLHDDVGTVLARTDYHQVAAGYGGRGLLIAHPGEVEPVLEEALRLARAGSPVVVNAHLGRTEFRKGSISI